MTDWQTKSSEVVYKTNWLEVVRDEVTNQRGKDLTYSYVRLPAAAVTIVATNEKNEILLQKNYRYTIKQTLWEIPAGHSDGQEPLVAAKRELLEESGLESDDWASLGEARLATGIADVHHYLFHARNAKPVTDERDEDEDITEQQFFPVDKVREMVLANEIVDGDTLIGLYRFLLQEKEDS